MTKLKTEAEVDAMIEDVKAGIDLLQVENAQLRASNLTLVAAVWLARGEMVDESGYPETHPSILAMDAAVDLAKRKPQGLSRLNAREMAGART